MRTITFLVILLLLTGTPISLLAQSQDPVTPKVKVIYFHGNNRCMTCLNMEKYTRELLEEEYSKELNSKQLVFEIVNFDDDALKEITEKYKVESSTLLLVKIKNGKEKVTDLTDIGFSYAKNEPEKFKLEIRKKLNEKLM